MSLHPADFTIKSANDWHDSGCNECAQYHINFHAHYTQPGVSVPDNCWMCDTHWHRGCADYDRLFCQTELPSATSVQQQPDIPL